MTLDRLLRGIISRLGIWWGNYYIMQTVIDINIIDEKFKNLSEKIPFEIRRLKLEDYLTGDKEYLTSTKMNKYKKWFEDENRISHGIIINNELAHHSWVCFNKIELTNKTALRGFENTAALQDAYCNPKYRGRGFHNYNNLYSLKIIYDRGINNALGIVAEENLPALKVQKNSSLIITKKLTLISVFGKEFVKYKEYDS